MLLETVKNVKTHNSWNDIHGYFFSYKMTKKWLTNTCKPLKHHPRNCQTERSRMSIPEAPNRQPIPLTFD